MARCNLKQVPPCDVSSQPLACRCDDRDPMKAVVVMPTYNERENLSRLIPQLLRVFDGLAHELHVLVVDDNSPDGTADVVRAFAHDHTNVHLNVGRKNGLGAAYIRGI